MKYLYVFLMAAIVASGLVGCAAKNELDAYKAYYKASEALLDTLENHYNWVDAHDPYEYYSAKELVNKLPK
jgi:hypothetical protein